jgi:hypothetical protein
MLNDLLSRIKYNLLCVFCVDGSWSMGADLDGSLFPLGGYWVNGKGTFNRYIDSQK